MVPYLCPTYCFTHLLRQLGKTDVIANGHADLAGTGAQVMFQQSSNRRRRLKMDRWFSDEHNHLAERRFKDGHLVACVCYKYVKVGIMTAVDDMTYRQ